MAVDRPTFSESWYRVADLRPGLRSTIQVHRQHFRSQMWHVLQDPGTNQYFRLSESAYTFIAMLDGRKSVAEVWKICNEELGDAAPTQGEVIQLMGQLYTSNLLQADVPPDAEGLLQRYRKRRSREVRGYMMNLLFIRIPIYDPDSFLNRWVSIFGKAFTKWGLMIWAIVIAIGLYSIGGRTAELASRANGVLDPDNLFYLYISFAFVKLFHEMGHGFSCKRFGLESGGGEVHTIGIMFLVFTPMPYVDASSSWVLRNKWQRACVGIGGMYVELFIAAIAAVIWANTSTGTVHAICYNIMFIASVSTLLFNANPLLRYDGYYILSDYLEIPNLAQRSKQYIYYTVRKYIYGVKNARTPAYSRGERFWFPIYGVASTIYRVFICTAILMFVAEKFFLVGVILALVAVITWVGVPLVNFLRYLFTNRELARTRARALLTTAVFLLAIFFAIGVIKFPDHLRAEGIVEPMHIAIVYAGESGFVENVLPSGTEVSLGNQILVESTNRDLATDEIIFMADRKQLEIERRIARREEQASVQIYTQKIEFKNDQIKKIRKQLANLKIRAPFDGVWLSPNTDSMKGRYLQRGDPVGMLADFQQLRIRASAGQRIVGPIQVEGQLEVEIRVKGRPDLELTGHIEEIFQAGTTQLFSPAQGFQAGGAVQTATDDPKGMKSAENFFEIRIIPDQAAAKKVRLLNGQRVVIRFKLKSKPLMVQWWHSLLQMVQQRFHIS